MVPVRRSIPTNSFPTRKIAKNCIMRLLHAVFLSAVAASVPFVRPGRTLRVSPRRRYLQAQTRPSASSSSYSGATPAPTAQPTKDKSDDGDGDGGVFVVLFVLCCCCFVVAIPCLTMGCFLLFYALLIHGFIKGCALYRRGTGQYHAQVAPAPALAHLQQNEMVILQAHLPQNELPVAQVVSHTPAPRLERTAQQRALTTAIVVDDSRSSFSRLSAAARSD